MRDKASIKQGLLFMSMMVSAAAMDSENPVIPGSICLLSVLMLYMESKKRLPGKERINSKVQEMGWNKDGLPNRKPDGNGF